MNHPSEKLERDPTQDTLSNITLMDLQATFRPITPMK